jgi:glycerol-3-phosphate dehydrogenase
LMAAVESQFPSMAISLEDVISTYSGVRPVIGSGKHDPSDESRDHVIWQENGLFTVTGGKLTTFRIIALDVLKAIRHRLPEMLEPDSDMPVLNQIDQKLPGCDGLRETCRRRLLGRYGSEAVLLVNAAKPGEMENIPGTEYLWAELRWAARTEGVCHLDDLLLRRTRLGLILANGAESIFPVVELICSEELNWDQARWQNELSAYRSLHVNCYSLPPRETIPDWRELLAEAKIHRKNQSTSRRKKIARRSSQISLLLLLISVFLALLRRQHQKNNRV